MYKISPPTLGQSNMFIYPAVNTIHYVAIHHTHNFIVTQYNGFNIK